MKWSFLPPLFLALMVMLSNNLSAQNKKGVIKKPGVLLGANFLYNSPKGAFAGNYKNGVGVEVTGGLGLGKTFLTATYGSGRFFSEAGGNDLTYKPIKVGLRRFIIGKNIFAAAEVGNASINDKNKGMVTNNFIYAYGGGLRLAGLEAGIYFNGLKGNANSNSNNFIQYKVGWSLVL